MGGKRRDFTVACGVGFDADVMEGTDPTQKGRWGKIAYLASAIRETGNIRNGPHTITLDGVRTDDGRGAGAGRELRPRAARDQGPRCSRR